MKYERSKIGQSMYDFLAKAAKPLMGKDWAVLLLNYTWGLLWVVIGWIVYAFVKTAMKKQVVKEDRYLFNTRLVMRGNFGGCSLGNVFLVSENPAESTCDHECGHTIQNAILGPLFIFLVAIPSGIRYQYQNYRTRKGLENKPYDSIYFEQAATVLGAEYHKTKNN